MIDRNAGQAGSSNPLVRVLGSRGFRAGALVLFAGFGVELVRQNGLILEGTLEDLAVFFVQLTLPPTALFAFIIAGFLAPPLPFLAGIALGLLDATLIAILVALAPGAAEEAMGTSLLEGLLPLFGIAILVGGVVTGAVAWIVGYVNRQRGRRPAGSDEGELRDGEGSGGPTAERTARFPDEGTWESAAYRRANKRANVGQVIWAIATGTSAAVAMVRVQVFPLLDRIEQGVWTQTEVDSWLDSLERISSSDLAWWGIAGLALIVWLSRFVDNVPALAGGIPRRSPRRTILYWLVPIVDLIMVPIVVRDVARRMSRDGRGHDGLIALWWGSIAFTAVTLVVTTVFFNDAIPLEIERLWHAYWLIDDVAFVIQGALTVLLIRRLQADEDHWAGYLGTRSASPQRGDPVQGWPGTGSGQSDSH